MEIKQMVEAIVRELVKQELPRPKVLYLFYDSTAHEAFTDHFITLNIHGIDHDRLFLDGEASCWLGKHRIECGGRGRTIAADEFAPSPLEVPMEYEGIVIPEIDLDNAARAALGLKGTMISEIIFSALVQQKFVLIGEDISGLKRADRRTLQTLTLPKPYRNLLDYYMMELQMYGVEFAPVKLLAERAASKLGKPPALAPEAPASEMSGPEASGPNAPEASEPHVTSAPATAPLICEGRLVSADWLARELAARPFRTLRVGKRTIISALAQDMLKERNIAVEFIGEG
ncbi:hypothetical protein ACFPES_31370 [Paenibacillus sp. GCM10023248]|uniref:hypothetical protein n=1 Tax=unclassified Paenibacillus TaxID=185978 RepID=UPI002378B0FF|nr:hypothetical protein [Paenibacillus sp. MAHUQ-63]MDD9271543.1 hypothetical protein [Paenibacillus sp. MAHUQ-63]